MDGEGAPRGSRGRPRGRARARARGTRGVGGVGRGASSASTIAASSTPNDTEMPDASAGEPSSTSTNAAPSIKPDPDSTPNTSSAPQSISSRSVTPTRGAAPRGRVGRFLPRAIRRSAIDREAIANQEISKVEDQEKQEARLKRAVRGGRGGGRRARGGPVNFGAIIRGGGGGFGSGIQASTASRSKPSPFLGHETTLRTAVLIFEKLEAVLASVLGAVLALRAVAVRAVVAAGLAVVTLIARA